VAHANRSPAALATGYHDALWALGVIVLLALPVTFALIRGTGRRTMIARSESPKPQTAVAAAK
jgi:hypothetical protein